MRPRHEEGFEIFSAGHIKQTMHSAMVLETLRLDAYAFLLFARMVKLVLDCEFVSRNAVVA